MKQFLLSLILLAAVLTASAYAGDKKPTPTPTPPPAPVAKALSIVQMQQLTIVQVQQRAAAQEAAKFEAQQRALTREFAWALGVNPEDYEPELKPLDERAETWGFVPKPKPNPAPEPGKEAKPETKQDGKS